MLASGNNMFSNLRQIAQSSNYVFALEKLLKGFVGRNQLGNQFRKSNVFWCCSKRLHEQDFCLCTSINKSYSNLEQVQI